MKIVGIGGLLGILVGIGVAEWVGNASDTSYYSIVTFAGIVGTVLSTILSRKNTSDE